MQDVVLHQVGAQQLLHYPWQHHHHKLVMVGFQPLGRLGYLLDWIDGGLE